MTRSQLSTPQAPTIVAFGEVLWDLLPSGPVLGGAPLNFVYRVNSLGYRGIMISQLGTDTFGDRALEQMKTLGLDTSFVQRTSEHPTGTVKVTLDGNKSPDFTILPDVAYDYIRHTPDMNTLVSTAGCLCFGSVAQRSEASRKTLETLLDVFSGPYVLYDINLRKDCYTADIIKTSLIKSNILKLNDGEVPVVAEIYELPIHPLPEFIEGLFRTTRLDHCLVTLGARGAFAASRDGKKVSVPAYRINLVDTCGSGDAFSAGFLYALLAQKNLQEACQFGNALGAMVAEQSGATQPVTPDALARFMQEREKEE